MKYYKTDSRRISFREYFHIARSRFFVGWFSKIFGVQIKLPRGIPERQPFRDTLIEAAEIPVSARDKLNAGILEFKQLGFDQFWFNTLKESLMGTTNHAVTALHPQHQVMGRIVRTVFGGLEANAYIFFSELSDGQVVATTNNKPMFRAPPQHIVQRLVGASAVALWQLHHKKLAQFEKRHPLRPVANLDQLAALDGKILQAVHEDKITRGIWVEMNDAEVVALQASRPPPLPK